MAPTFRVVYKRVDDCEIFADVYVPEIPPSQQEKRPVGENAMSRIHKSKLKQAVLIIHGGAFCLGHSAMVSADQVQDMLERGWVVVSLEHRLCPQVSIVDGPIADARSCLNWVLDGSLEKELGEVEASSMFKVDYKRIVAVGTSSGGTLALALVSTNQRAALL